MIENDIAIKLAELADLIEQAGAESAMDAVMFAGDDLGDSTRERLYENIRSAIRYSDAEAEGRRVCALLLGEGRQIVWEWEPDVQHSQEFIDAVTGTVRRAITNEAAP